MNHFDADMIIPTPVQTHDAQCWAFMGAMGGAGVTSIAIQTAYSAMKALSARAGAPGRVCLIDLDFEGGAVAPYLDLIAGIKSEHLMGDASRIDTDMASAFVCKHETGLHVLAAPNLLGGNDRVSPDCVLALMDAASTLYDIIVLDIPRIWRPWTHAAIAAADKFYLVTELNIPALHITRKRARDIEMQASLQDGVKIIINKYERRILRSSLTVKDAAHALEREIDHLICVHEDATRDAMNCGKPAGNLDAGGRFVKDVNALTQNFLSLHEQGIAEYKRKLLKHSAA
ncbi:AAA family ATPase [Robiginitomaculum antarcticum]|uniref:AAA family ATPase n=1 Tax=Robiginitomaculum antarcticum TaxID=437507 RepID=UPI00036EDC34|nr:hypothetical protein [Robiginitomaculum antarcticum]